MLIAACITDDHFVTPSNATNQPLHNTATANSSTESTSSEPLEFLTQNINLYDRICSGDSTGTRPHHDPDLDASCPNHFV